MNLVQKIEHWGDVHHAKWLDSIRIVLGLLILSKGLAFISDTDAQKDWIIQNSVFGFSGLMALALVHTVAFVHLVGGGSDYSGACDPFCSCYSDSYTFRGSIFVNLTKGFSSLNSELWLSVLVLITTYSHLDNWVPVRIQLING